MNFTKMEGLGNDYVYVDGFREIIDNPSETAVAVSDRHFGIGSDGLIIIKPSDKADFFMEMYNADGSQGKMCGNGIRCVGKYVYDNGLTDKTDITIDTLAGIRKLHLNIAGGMVSTVRVDMGTPVFTPAQIPVTLDGDKIVDRRVNIGGMDYNITCVSMGNPHCVTYVNDVNSLAIDKIGPRFENSPMFPDRINTEFVTINDKNTITMRVWERGSGETLACGTGACAAAAASIINGWCSEKVTVRLRGGDLCIEWDRPDNRIYMEGPAVTVFTGKWDR